MFPKSFRRKKICQFCRLRAKSVDYKNVDILKRYVDNRARIKSRRRTGVCAKHQRELSSAIERARQMALLPYK